MTQQVPLVANLWTQPSQQSHFPGYDGLSLHYRNWLPPTPVTRGLVLFHGGHEHSGRFQELVDQLALPNTAVFAWDARGHGLSPGERGDAHHFMDLVRDADAFIRHIHNTHGLASEDLAVLGHSVGSVIITTWLHDYAPQVRAAVLGSPAFELKLYVPLALPGLRLLEKFNAEAHVSSYVHPGMLTHDKVEAAARRQDPLISPRISVRVLTSLFDTAQRVIQGAANIQTPLLLFSAGSDWVVKTRAQQRFFERLGSTDKHLQSLPGFYHEIFHEQQRTQVISQAREFLRRRLFADANPYPAPVESHRAQYRRLSQPLAWYHPARSYYAIIRGLMASLGHLSHGIRLGWQQGFDSGPMLDYVYRNQAGGDTPLGRLLDGIYLQAPGWQGIRRRGELLRDQLVATSRALRASGRSVHIADLAAGQGRYLLDALEQLDDPQVSAVCRDKDPLSLEAGQTQALARGLNRVRFETGDAFDPLSLQRLRPRPDIVVVSGLYELFADNALIRRSLRAIHDNLKPGGYLLLTNQPWHPQLEFIARVLPNREGQAWVMRPRSQGEWLMLLQESGFRHLALHLENQGIFSVNLAQREDSA